MERFYISLLIVLIVGGITLGNALAVTFNESVTVDADGPTSLTVKADSGQPNILFSDVGSHVFKFTIPDGSEKFTITSVTTSTNMMVIDGTNGNVGLGTGGPQERLHVVGNIKLTGNIVSDGDICIGNCP